MFNLLNRKGSDIDFYYASRLKGEPAGGAPHIHYRPVESRSVRLWLIANF